MNAHSPNLRIVARRLQVEHKRKVDEAIHLMMVDRAARERDQQLEAGIREIVTLFSYRAAARRDARAHVRKLLEEAYEFRRRLLVAHCTGAYHIGEYENAFRAAEYDCIQAFKIRNKV